MRPILIAAAIIAALCGLAAAQITVPERVDPHQPIVAELQNQIPEGAQVQGGWSCATAAFLPVSVQKIHVWAPPGKHTIVFRGVWIKTRSITIDGQDVQVLEGFGFLDEQAMCTVGEDPGPDPPPPPPGSRWALVVEETAERTVPQANLWVALRKEFPLSRMLIIDRDTQANSVRKYLDAIPPDMPLPVLCIVHQDSGELIRVVPVPGTVEAFKEELAR